MPETSFNRAARWTGFGLAIVVTILIAVITNREGYKKREFREVQGYKKWSEEVVEIAKRIPVQDGGRMKPLETRAGFLMLKLHGARKMKIKTGGKKISIGPTEWFLDVLFRPELAMKMVLILVHFGFQTYKVFQGSFDRWNCHCSCHFKSSV